MWGKAGAIALGDELNAMGQRKGKDKKQKWLSGFWPEQLVKWCCHLLGWKGQEKDR